MDYHLLKIIHILSATVMIGTGAGSAFYLFVTYKKSQFSTVRDVLQFVIIADLIFTTPSVITQLITGLMLSDMLGFTDTNWYWLVLSIGFIILILWLVAAYIQVKMKKLIEDKTELPAKFHQLMTIWFYLGVPSFLGAIYLYYLMIYKPFM